MDHGTGGIGSRLHQAREQRGLSLLDIANATKISMTALKAIERNDFARLPGGVFRRAYVRAFAAEVGLNADEVVREYRSVFEPEIPADQLLVHRTGCEGRAHRPSGVATAAVVGAVVLIGGFLLSKPARIPQEPPERTLNEVVAGPPDSTAPIDESDGFEESSFAATAVAEGGAPALRLEILATGLCWVSAAADGERVLYRLMHPGERTLVEARSAIALRVGDAGALTYSVNGTTGRPLGQTGEAVTVRITSDSLGSLRAEPTSRFKGADVRVSPASSTAAT